MKFKGRYRYNRQTPCVYKNLKVVFHGIPKNASTTIKNALYEAEHGKEFNGNKQWVHKGNEKGGSIYPSLEEIETNYEDYLHLTVVRDPYTRFRSFYSDLFLGMTSIRDNIPPFYIDNNINFLDNDIESVLDIIEYFSDDDADEHFASQKSFLHYHNVHWIEMEHLNEQWSNVCNRLDIAFDPLPVYNKTNNHVMLTDDQKERIFNRYKDDFWSFNYAR